VVRADVDLVQRDRLAHLAVHLVEVGRHELAVGKLRLIGEDDAEEASIAKPLDLGASLRHQRKVFDPGRGVRRAVTHDRFSQDAVTVQEDCSPAPAGSGRW
jgi:hypothetical protein